MGTSSLYRGPKITSLLPPDYDPDANLGQDAPNETIPAEDGAEEAEPSQGDPEKEKIKRRKINLTNLLSNGAQHAVR